MSRLKLEERNKSCKKFSKIIARILDLTNASKAEFSSKTGIAPALLSNYLHGRTTPNWAMLERISSRLKISPNLLFGSGDEKEIPNLSMVTAKPVPVKEFKSKRGRPKKIDSLQVKKGRPVKEKANLKK